MNDQTARLVAAGTLGMIVSGGQTGADRGGLLAALEVGLLIGGWAPRGFRAEDGVIPTALRGRMRDSHKDYAGRTRMNVRDSNATLIVSFSDFDHLSPGTALTVRECRAMKRPCRHVCLPHGRFPGEGFRHVADAVARWVLNNLVTTLNVAGPRESREPGIELATREVVASVLDALMGDRATVARAAYRAGSAQS